MIDVNSFEKNSLFQKISFGKSIVNVNIRKVVEHPIHFHRHLEIVLVLSGEVSVKSSAAFFKLGRGDWAFLNAFEIHGIKSITEEAVIAYIHFDLEMKSTEEPLFLYDSEVLKNDEKIYNRIRNWLIRLIDIVCFEKSDNAQLNEYTRELIRFINGNLKYVMYEIEGDRNNYQESDLYIERFNDILNYMYLHYDEKLSLEHIAKQFNISKFYFSHMLKNCFNRPFRDVLNMVRADRAELLVLGSVKSMTRICDEVGFSSYQYFVRQFKEYFGMTPMQYRRVYQKETIKYKAVNEYVCEITSEQLKSGIIGDNCRKEEDSPVSLELNLKQGKYSVMTVMENYGENNNAVVDSFELENGNVVIEPGYDEVFIRIRRKN